MLSLLWTAIIGLIVGAVAKLIMPGKDPGGIWITMLIGIAGSFFASWLGRLLGWYQEGQSAGFIMSVIGALILLAIYHFIKRKSCVASWFTPEQFEAKKEPGREEIRDSGPYSGEEGQLYLSGLQKSSKLIDKHLNALPPIRAGFPANAMCSRRS